MVRTAKRIRLWISLETEISEKFYRPAEVDAFIGDTSKAEKILGWKNRTTFKEIVSIMMEAEMAYTRRQ